MARELVGVENQGMGGLGLLPEIMEEVAALKLLQPVPLCPALDVLIAGEEKLGVGKWEFPLDNLFLIIYKYITAK